MIEIVFKIYSLKSIAVDSLISVVIRGCKTIQIPVKANIILPKIRVEN